MTALAALATQHNAAEQHPEAEQYRNEIAEPRKGRSGVCGRREHGVDGAGGAPRKRLHDVAPGIDDGTDARRRRAQDRKALFRRAEARLRKVLRRPPAAEPGVVGRVEDEGRAVALVHHVAGEDDLVAELETHLAPLQAEVDRARAWPGSEVKVSGRKARDAERREQGPHR